MSLFKINNTVFRFEQENDILAFIANYAYYTIQANERQESVVNISSIPQQKLVDVLLKLNYSNVISYGLLLPEKNVKEISNDVLNNVCRTYIPIEILNEKDNTLIHKCYFYIVVNV